MNRCAAIVAGMVAGALACLQAAVAPGHHSTNGIYDESELVEIIGTVRQWRFVNPHPSLIIEVIGENGAVQEWDVSYGGAAVTHLRRRGYSETTFSPGDTVRVSGYVALVDTAFGMLVSGDPVKADGSPIF